jgi:hypothetical protein
VELNLRAEDLLVVILRQVVKPEALKHFNAGVAYVDDPTGSKWKEAYTEFRAAYAIHAT